MPYTPPAQQSPIASRSESPSISRTHSFSKTQAGGGPSLSLPERPHLPRSASSTSYLHKHRRSPSWSKPTPSTSDSPPATHDVQPVNSDAPAAGGTDGRSQLDTTGSLRQSPPPLNVSLIPIGALMSPPDSSQNSSDEDERTRRRRGRELENLAELQAAIRIIEQHRESSPNRTNEAARKARIALGLMVPSKDLLDEESKTAPNSSKPPLSKEARKISHSRSSTVGSALLDLTGTRPGRETDSSDPEDDENDGLRDRPPMVRKKSGELVRPALRPSFSKRRPSSMPGTPTYSKAVHFDSQLEHVRHFLQVDKPLAVSAGSSPVETFEGELEFPFGGEETFQPRSPKYEWEIRLPNFPRDTFERRSKPVRVERVFLSADTKNLIGVVAVANLAFHKLVVARFTLDYWKTTSEVVAEFSNDVRRKQTNDGHDRFNFTIKLADQANLENKTMFFCVRYNVNGREYWDNNDSINFQVDFTKKPKPENGQQSGIRASNALPRSKPPQSNPSGRPWSMPATFDDFTHGFDSIYDFGAFPQSPNKLMGESPIRFRNSKPTSSIIPDAPTKRNNPAAQAFGNRYDFGASLSAAIQAASTTLGDRNGLQGEETSKAEPKRASFEARNNIAKESSQVPKDGTIAQNRSASNGKKSTSSPPPANAGTGKDSAMAAANSSSKPSLQSSSYHELLDKYCFVSFGFSMHLTRVSMLTFICSSDLQSRHHHFRKQNWLKWMGVVMPLRFRSTTVACPKHLSLRFLLYRLRVHRLSRKPKHPPEATVLISHALHLLPLAREPRPLCRLRTLITKRRRTASFRRHKHRRPFVVKASMNASCLSMVYVILNWAASHPVALHLFFTAIRLQSTGGQGWGPGGGGGRGWWLQIDCFILHGHDGVRRRYGSKER